MYLYELRNLWQLFFHVTVGAFVTLQIWLRQAQSKAPDYDVWPSFRRIAWASGGHRREHILTATVKRKLFTTNEKLCFLSLQLSFLFKSTWHACEHAVPSRQTPLRRKLALRLLSEEEETSLQSCSRGRAVSAIGTLASRPESLLKSSIKYILIFGGPSRNSPIGVCLGEALV